ncbi:MAG: hypothetical protein ACTSQX_01965 [Candidatus Heimdallarchaeota archaeon]
MNGESSWYKKGINSLAKEIDRQKKSVKKAVDSLQEKNMISTQKEEGTIWIKHTLSDEELNTRMAFISDVFCQPQSLQELIKDLNNEIERLEDEIKLTEEKIAEEREENKIMESVIKRITSDDLEKFARCLVAERTNINVSKSIEEFIKDELTSFRTKIFIKYAGTDKGGELINFNIKKIRYMEELS